MLLTKPNICVTYEPTVMTNEWFWSNARKSKTTGSNNNRTKETSAYTPSEETNCSRLNIGKKDGDTDNEYVDDSGDDDNVVSINISVAGDARRTEMGVINGVDDVPFKNLSVEKKIEENELVLKNLGNISRKTLHKKYCLWDNFCFRSV